MRHSCLAILALLGVSEGLQLHVSEGLPKDTVVGRVSVSPPFLVVPSPSSPSLESDLAVDASSGVITTLRELDRETVGHYMFSVVGLSERSESEEVEVVVDDVDDNAPVFQPDHVDTLVAENTPIGTRRKLPEARDPDEGRLSYEIAEGNEQNFFLLDTKSLELVVNANLDREEYPQGFKIVVLAKDGFKPVPRTARLLVQVKLQDLNDNAPVFSQQRYFTSIASTSSPGTVITTVKAEDEDLGANGEVHYSINGRQSAIGAEYFSIDAMTGVVSVAKSVLDLDLDHHELVVVATDGGDVAQEASAFVTIRVLRNTNNDGHDDTVGIVYFDDDNDGVAEDTPLMEPFAKLVTSNTNDEYVLEDSPNFLLMPGLNLALSKNLDYEKQKKHVLTVRNKRTGHLSRLEVTVLDVNDNQPLFEKQVYNIEISESEPIGSVVLALKATDKDVRSDIKYSLVYDNELSAKFRVDAYSGEVSLAARLECGVESGQLRVLARESGNEAEALVRIRVRSDDEHAPLFEHSFYETKVKEDVPIGHCFLTVHATDRECGSSSLVQYSLSSSWPELALDPDSGSLCVSQPLDRETQSDYTLTIHATDKGGLSTSASVVLSVLDVDDESPVFAPAFYSVSIDSNFDRNNPLLKVWARDEDSDPDFGSVRYSVLNNNIFDVDQTGNVFFREKNAFLKEGTTFDLTVLASDNDYSDYHTDRAEIRVKVLSSMAFEKPVITFRVSEDVSPYTRIGVIRPLVSSYSMSIESSNTGEVALFSLDSNTGELRSEARLDHERFELVLLQVRLEVENEKGDMDHYYVQVQVEVEDVNDNAPEFSSEMAVAEIAEDADIGHVVYVCKAVDADSGPNGHITFSSLAANNFFALDPATGQVTVQRSLDYETQRQHELLIEAKDGGEIELKSVLRLLIEVRDINDNAPVFEQSVYEISVPSNLPLNAPLLSVRATDADEGDNGRVFYKLVNAEPDLRLVSLMEDSGIVLLKSNKDNHKVIRLTIDAVDRGQPALSSSSPTLVILKMAERNDHSPVFEEDNYEFAVKENLDAGTHVGLVNALDPDQGANGQIQYVLLHENSGLNSFAINKNSGIITTINSLDREQRDKYELVVEARDEGEPPRSSQTLVKIEVEDENDNQPMLIEPHQGLITVSLMQWRRVRPGQSFVIANLVVKDVDQEDQSDVHVQLQGPNSMLSVDSSLAVHLLKPLSASSPANFTATLILTDRGEPSKQLLTPLSIVFSSTSSSLQTQRIGVKRGSELGSVIHNVKPWPQSYIRVVSSNNDFDKFFYLDAIKGDLYVISDLNEINGPEFDVRLTAEPIDPKQEVRQYSDHELKIIVEDANDENIVVIKDPVNIDVTEDTENGAKLLDLSSIISLRKESMLNFGIIEELPSNKHFGIDNNWLILEQKLDYEQLVSHVVVVRVSDGKMFVDVSLIINVLDVNDHRPEFFDVTDTIRISADIRLNTPIYTVLIRDLDQNDNGEVTLSLQNEVFEVRDQSIVLKQVPKKSFYTFTVLAEDKGLPRLSSERTFSVEVSLGSKESSSRFESSLFVFNVTENEDQAVIGSVNWHSSDLSVKPVLLNNDYGTRKLFRLEPNGRLRVLSPLDREKRAKYVLIVALIRESNSEEVLDTSTVDVNVVDVNDNEPRFGIRCRDFEVIENDDSNFIATITAEDDDFEEEIKYTLFNEDSNHGDLFRVDANSGQIRLNKPLDRETQMEHSLVLSAKDKSGKSDSCKFRIRVKDLNDNAPSFESTQYEVDVYEDLAVGEEVLRLRAEDRDEMENGQIEYSIDSNMFSIDKDTGTIRLFRSLDREIDSKHTLKVIAQDKGRIESLNNFTMVTIFVKDINDNAPRFTEFPFVLNISSSSSPSSPLLTLTASDPDAGPNSALKFGLKQNTDDSNIFSLTPRGELRLNENNWLRPKSSITLEVEVMDQGLNQLKSSGLIEVNVDGGPESRLAFEQNFYSAKVEEHVSIGVDVIEVKALRIDGKYEKLVYTIIDGNHDDNFEINSNTGLIRVRGQIDRERRTKYDLIVSARSVSNEPLVAYTKIEIDIKDRDDNEPRFPQEVYVMKVKEGVRKGTVLGQVKAFDKDILDNIKYEIGSGNLDNAFTIDKKGFIYTHTILDREIRELYALTIVAQDKYHRAKCQVEVHVLDENDNAPHLKDIDDIFINEQYKGSIVTVIRARDIDLGPNIKYELIEGKENFELSSSSGELVLISKAITNNQKIVVQASDGVHVVETNFNVIMDECIDKEFDLDVYTMSVGANVSLPFNMGSVGLKCELDVEFASDNEYIDVDANTGLVSLVKWPNKAQNNILATVKAFNKNFETSTIVMITRTTASKELSLINNGGHLLHLRRVFNEPLVLTQVHAATKTKKNVHFWLESPPSFLAIDSINGQVYQKHLPNKLYNEEITVKATVLGRHEISASIKLRIVADPTLVRGQRAKINSESVEVSNNEVNSNINEVCNSRKKSLVTKITSGNRQNSFRIEQNQVLKLAKEPPSSKMQLVLTSLSASNTISVCSLTLLFKEKKRGEKESKKAKFLLNKVVIFVEENSQIGSELSAPPVLFEASRSTFDLVESSNMFGVDRFNGQLRVKRALDFENEQHRSLTPINLVMNEKEVCEVKVCVVSVDEYAPVFEQSRYFFRASSELNVGDALGQIRATDKDEGRDGVVVYELDNDYFGVDDFSGIVRLIRPLDTDVLNNNDHRLSKRSTRRDVRLTIRASSGNEHSLRATATLDISIDASSLPLASTGDTANTLFIVLGSLVGAILLLLLLALVIFMRCRVLKSKKSNNANETVGNLNAGMELNSSDKPARNRHLSPPQYSEIVSEYSSGSRSRPNKLLNTNSRSEVSEKSQSSGHGSVEEDEDEAVDVEIRMINENTNNMFYANHSDHVFNVDNDDNASHLTDTTAIQDTEAYLARLGIDVRKPSRLSTSSLVYNNNSIYNRIPDTMSERVYGHRMSNDMYSDNLLTEDTNSVRTSDTNYNWDYLLDWGPQYQPLAHVFKDISMLDDEPRANRKCDDNKLMSPNFRPNLSPLANTDAAGFGTARAPALATPPVGKAARANSTEYRI